MGQKWSQLSAEEKKPYEDEAYRIYAANVATFKAAQGGSVGELSDGPGKRCGSLIEFPILILC